MPPPARNAYAGGYSETIKRQLEQVVIPDKIKCVNCKKIRMQASYSNRQLDNVRHGVVTKGIRATSSRGVAKCRECNSGQTVELKCCICDKIKGLDEFAKAQRQFHDAARCLNCVQSITETELVDEQKLLPESELTTQDSALTRSYLDDELLSGATQRLDLGSPYSRSGFSGFDDDEVSVGGGVWVESAAGNDENSISKDKGRMYTGFDSNGVAHRRFTDSVSGGGEYTPNSRSRYESAATELRKLDNAGKTQPPPPLPQKKVSNFAKVPGRRVPVADAPSMRVNESTGPGIPSDDEDDDNAVEDFL